MIDFGSRLSDLAMYSLAGGALSLLLFSQHSAASRHTSRYAPVYFPQALPFYMLAFLLLAPFYGPNSFTRLVHVLTAALAYSALLWALTPLLRRRISAQGCAALWLLPNLLFFPLIAFRFPIDPLVIIRLTRRELWIALGVWAVGFMIVLIWKLVAHLRFRRAVLRDAVPVSVQERNLFLSTWRGLCVVGDVLSPSFKRNIKASEMLSVLRSPTVDSPLSIGLLKKTRCLVLPQRAYSEDELRVIFRHETIHLLHGDNWLKFTLSFLCAAGWFLPMLWLGMGKAAEELELCCDELATDGAEEDRRREYVHLLLSNAGTAKGFTTCLSASASGLRYRMARVLHPKKRRAGFLAVFLLSVVAFSLCAMVGFKAVGGTVQTELLDRDGGGWHVSEVYYIFSAYGCPLRVSTWDPDICKQFENAIMHVELEKALDYPERLGHDGEYRECGPPEDEIKIAPLCFRLERGDDYERQQHHYICLYDDGLKFDEWNDSTRLMIYHFSDPTQVDLESLHALLPMP